MHFSSIGACPADLCPAGRNLYLLLPFLLPLLLEARCVTLRGSTVMHQLSNSPCSGSFSLSVLIKFLFLRGKALESWGRSNVKEREAIPMTFNLSQGVCPGDPRSEANRLPSQHPSEGPAHARPASSLQAPLRLSGSIWVKPRVLSLCAIDIWGLILLCRMEPFWALSHLKRTPDTSSLNARSSPLQTMTTKKVSRHGRMSPGGGVANRFHSSTDNHWSPEQVTRPLTLATPDGVLQVTFFLRHSVSLLNDYVTKTERNNVIEHV